MNPNPNPNPNPNLNLNQDLRDSRLNPNLNQNPNQNTRSTQAEADFAKRSDADLFIQPPSGDMLPGATLQFKANKAVKWNVTAGVITPEGLYTAPKDPTAVRLTATAIADASDSLTIPITVRGTAASAAAAVAGRSGPSHSGI